MRKEHARGSGLCLMLPILILGLPLAPAAASPEAASLASSARAAAESAGVQGKVTISDLLRQELAGLRRISASRVALERVRVGRHAAQGELRRLDTVLGESRRKLKSVAALIQTQRARLRARIRVLYRIVQGTSRLPLLDGRRAAVPRDGRHELLRIIGRDVAEVRALDRERKLLVGTRDQVQKRRRQAIAVLRDLDRRRDALQALIAQARQELAGLRHRRRNHQGHAKEWNAEAYRLERAVVAFHVRLKQKPRSFVALRGSLVRPVPGMILKWYGQHGRKGTRAKSLASGVEISALPNWKVRAPADGTVRFAGQVPTYGNVVILEHSGGYLTVTGHLGQILVRLGQRVSAGKPMATLRGAPRGTRLAVYFELRRSGRSIDPTPWIHGGLAELRRRGPKALWQRRKPAPPVKAIVERE